MCNSYSVIKGHQAIRELYRAATGRTGDLPPLPGIFAGRMAPLVHNGAHGGELTMPRWGVPSRPAFQAITP